VAISTQECYLKIFISREWIHPVAKQTENNKLTNLTININSQHIQHDEVAIWNQSAISMRRFFTARRFAGAIYAVVMCPPVYLSVTSRYCIETTGRIELVFGTYSTPCCKEIWVSPKIRVLSSRTLCETSDLENFTTASRSRCWNWSSSSSTVELVDDTYTTVDESWLFTASRSTVTL